MQKLESDIFAGLNSDDEDRAVPKGDYRYALNIHTGSSDGGNKGAIVNLKGNTLVSVSLAPGTNKVVGTTRDQATQSIIYLVWNSLDDDQIYQFYEKTKTIELIAKADFNFPSDKIIHGIDLVDSNKLYWTDNSNEPRKINIEKAKNNKPREINLYFDVDSVRVWEVTDVTYTLTINGGAQTITNLKAGPSTPGSSSRDEVSERFAYYINQLVENWTGPGVAPNIEATGCGPYIGIKFTDSLENELSFTSDYSESISDWVPQNFYIDYNFDVINQIKAPNPCNPTFTYGRDPSRDVNLLEEKTFQFAVRYIYDDYEITVLSPYSCLAYEFTCGIANSGSNYIDVDFSDPRLFDRSSLSVIKKIDILVREGNDGKFKIAETLEQWNFGITNKVYRFYNDGIYTVISDEEAFKLYDTVPKKSETQEFMKNRLFHGNYTQGFDAVCVDAEVDVSYGNPPEEIETFTISGYIQINNVLVGLAGDNEYRFGQPVHAKDGSAIGWGGAGGDFSNVYISNYGQELPLEGFVVYLAGTTHKAITTQYYYDGASWVPVVGSGAFSEVGSRGAIKSDSSSLRNDIRDQIKDNNGFRQYFTISGVPKGQYIVRVAGHKTTQADLDSESMSYQKTSTNVSYHNGPSSIRTNTEGTYVVTSNLSNLEFRVQDLTVPKLFGKGEGICGYLVTDEVSSSGASIYNNPRIELGKVSYDCGGGGDKNDVVYSRQGFLGEGVGVNVEFFNAYADHNGYFFGAGVTAALGGSIRLRANGNDKILSENLNNVWFDESGNSWSGPTSDGTRPKTTGAANGEVAYVVGQTSINLDNVGAFVQCTAIDTVTGLSIPNLPIMISSSNVTQATDANGVFKARVWGDTYAYDTSGSITKQRAFTPAPIGASGSCLVVYDYTSVVISIVFPIGNGPSDYNLNSSPFIFSPPVDASVSLDDSDGYKRGWDGRFGLIYRDQGSRMSFVNTDEDLQTHVTFYTETDENGNQNNYGIPTLTWSINHIPPSWATHYQWVRTKNEQLDDYLQWIVDDVAYVDCEDFSLELPYSDAEIAKISIRNIADYADCGAKSFIGIAIDDSYRVRFIKDDEGNFYSTYVDLPILSATPDNIYIDKTNDFEIKAGALFEVYRPKSSVETKLYYEFGECHVITKKGLHSGETQNQKLWEFSDNAYAGVIGSISYATNVAFTTDPAISPLYSGLEHNYVVGDKVKIVQSIGYTNASYEDMHTVVEVLSNYTVVIDLPFGVSTPAEPGMMNAPAMGVFGCGDAYYRFRSINKCSEDLEGWYCESQGIGTNISTFNYIDDSSVSDFYLSEYQGIGRLNIENPNAREIISKNQVTWSGTIIEDSYVNSLNKFDGADIEDLPEEFGDLMRLQRGENVLLAIAQYKSASLYIQESVLTNTDGTGNLASSDKVIGTVRAFKDAYGTMNPESVAEYQSVVYWWDLNNASVVRYTQAGLQALSDNKFADFFAQKAKDILSNPLQEIPRTIGVYDPYFAEYIISFDSYVYQKTEGRVTSDVSVSGETLAYSEWISRWTSFYSYLPEKMEYIGMTTVAFKSGELWVQDDNPIRNNFFGVQYNSKVQPIANDLPKNIKAFRAVVVESNEVWSCPEITIPANSKYINGMKTRITKSRFVNKEGIFYSEIPKDLLTPGFSTQLEALIDGRDMRGKILNILFQNDDTSEVVFFSFNVKSNLSELSNR